MPQIRHNIATGEWVIVAPERAGRPKDFTAAKRTLQKASPAYLAACPFCPGNEHQTPPEVLCLPHDDGPWQARVVPNKFAALQRKDSQEQCSEGVYRALAGVGWHEVVIETPCHNAPPALQSDEEVARTLTAFQMRGLEMAQDPHVAHVLYVKNHGPDAGTSREHPHAQIMALPLVPPRTQARWEAARHYLDEHGACPLCALWQSEVASGERIVAASERFVAFVPYAAMSPYYIWIVPQEHRADFCQARPDELADLGALLRRVLHKIHLGLGDPSYNYVIQSASGEQLEGDHLHWYVEIIPRLVTWGGFELGSGAFINPALPEDDARFLRQVGNTRAGRTHLDKPA